MGSLLGVALGGPERGFEGKALEASPGELDGETDGETLDGKPVGALVGAALGKTEVLGESLDRERSLDQIR